MYNRHVKNKGLFGKGLKSWWAIHELHGYSVKGVQCNQSINHSVQTVIGQTFLLSVYFLCIQWPFFFMIQPVATQKSLHVSPSWLVGWLVVLGFSATLTAKVISWRSVTRVFPGFLTPVLTQLFFPKPPTTFLMCFCRGERRKYAGKKSRLNRG